jgi:diguanylate cyclase (GGDEF)-like protein/PAS domain S-box-containing protein
MKPTGRKANAYALPMRVSAFIGLVCAIIIGLSAWREWNLRSTYLHNAEVDMSNLARSLAQHADDTFELAETVLIGVVYRLEATGADAAAAQKLQAVLDLRTATMPRIRGLFIYGEDGRWLLSTEKVDLDGRNNSDRAYFQHHRDNADTGTFVGPPVHSRARGQWIITLSRRFNHPDGTFAGVLLITIDASYFSNFYTQFNIGTEGSISLIGYDGIVMSRSPDDGTYVGRDLSASPAFKEARSGVSAGVFNFRSALDGLQRLSYYKRSDRYPFIVFANQSREEVLAPWRQEVKIHMSVVLALVALIAMLGFYLVRKMLERQRLLAAMVSKEAEFRLLAEESSDMVTRIDFGGKILYASPSCSRVVGWRPEQLMGTPSLAGVNAEDLPRVELVVATLRCGEAEDIRVVYRTRHREKGEIWIESTIRATKNPDNGEINGVVAISRDMTDRVHLEAELATQATTDSLTGLGNRRRFDEHLEAEWVRARRAGTCLSILMIDVDQFKKFNDQYGHQAGDQCLQSLATVLAKHVMRPGDLAARYGGEEFALILPNTEAAGCAQVGERVCQAIRALGLVHEWNLPSRRVSVSLGGATAWPRDLRGSGEWPALIEAADGALYMAKDSGRNRLVMSPELVFS